MFVYAPSAGMTQSRFHAFDLSRAGARHRGAATLAALALALAASGCGGGDGNGGGGETQLSKTQYESLLQKDGNDIKNVFKPLSSPPSSLQQLSKSIKKGEDKLRAVAADLDGIKPPSEVADDNEKLVTGLRKLADQLEPLRQGAAEGNPQKVQKAVTAIQTSNSLKGAQEATADMKKKGYQVGELGR
jgi:hypothetical protein